jgi:hypothetical protein
VFGYLLQLYGFEWDVVWHVHERRESFWTAPHLMVYLGVALVLISGLLPLLCARGRVSPGLVLLAGAAGLQVAMAPVDDLWHRLYGLDNTLWSFPHLAFLCAGAASVAALAVLSASAPSSAVGAGERGARRVGGAPNRLVRAGWQLTALVLGPLPLFGLVLCALDVILLEFELNMAPPYWPWDYGLYPPLMIAAALLAGFAARALTGRAAALTLVCATYTAIQVGINLELLALGYRALPVVPLLVPSAVATDLLLRFMRGPAPLRYLLAGLTFSALFYLLLGPYGALVAPPRWPFMPSPWQPSALVAGWPLASLLAPLAVSLGLALGSALRDGGVRTRVRAGSTPPLPRATT